MTGQPEPTPRQDVLQAGQPSKDETRTLTEADVQALTAAMAAALPTSPFSSDAGDAQPLIDAEEAGRLLGVPDSWVRAQARAGAIPHVRLGHYVRFDHAALLRWRDEQAVGPTTSNQPVPRRSALRRSGGSTAGGTK